MSKMRFTCSRDVQHVALTNDGKKVDANFRRVKWNENDDCDENDFVFECESENDFDYVIERKYYEERKQNNQ